MKSSLLMAILCLGALSACQTGSDVSAPIFKQGPSARPNASVSPASVPLSAEERQLIGELAAMFTGDNAALIRRAFEDPFMVGSKTTNPRAQAIIDKIDAIRHIRTDSINKVLDAAKSKQPAVVAATIVLVTQLPDSAATAVVWRRSRLVPHDVIALRADNATVGALGAGVRMLMKLRKADGDSATADEHFAVRGEHVPPQWRGDMNAFVNSELYKLRQSEATSIPAFGMVRSRTMWLTAANSASTKP